MWHAGDAVPSAEPGETDVLDERAAEGSGQQDMYHWDSSLHQACAGAQERFLGAGAGAGALWRT
jgi:hypothetical protein